MFLRLGWLGFTALVTLFVCSQIVYPLLRGSVLFPLFRAPREGKLEGDLAHARQRNVEGALERELNRLKKSSR